MTQKYHYTMCGLDNVYINGPGVKIKNTDYGESVAIERIDDLHKAIALTIATGSFELTGKELRFLRIELDLSQTQFAAMIESTKQNIGRYERDELKEGIPGSVQMAARMLYLTFIRYPETAKVITELAELDRQMTSDRIFSITDGKWQNNDECVAE